MSYEDVKMERICSVCGVMYSEIITRECPVCELRKQSVCKEVGCS